MRPYYLLALLSLSLAITACGRDSAPAANQGAVSRPALASPAQESFAEAKAEFLARAEVRKQTLLNPAHAPLLLDHGHPTRYVVVIATGLYDSPRGQRPLAERLHARGFNVLVSLLPGHWDRDPARIDSATYAEYVEEQNTTVRLAKSMGEGLVLVGHSTGGLLALRSAIAEPRTAALVVSAPAFQLTPLTLALSSLGVTFGLSANFYKGPVDDLNTPYFSAYAGEQVRKLVKLTRNENGWVKNKVPAGQSETGLYQKMFAKVKAPTVLITDDCDSTVSNHVARLLPGSVSAPSLALTTDKLPHFEVGRWPGRQNDSPKELEYEAENKRLVDAAEAFLARQLPGYLSSVEEAR